MSCEDIMEQHIIIDRVNQYREKGWHIRPDANRVRVFPPKEIIEQFRLAESASWIAGASYQEALGFLDGFTEAAWLVNHRA